MRGMKWESLLETVEFCKTKLPNPDFIIIHYHVGAIDKTFSCSKKFLTEMQDD